MKQRKVVAMIGALVLIISAVVLITGCSQPNSNKENTGNNSGNISNNGGNTGGNNGSNLEVQPTAEADPALKGTSWKSTADDVSIEFTEKGNIATTFMDILESLYTINDSTIAFDLTDCINIFNNMTLERYFAMTIAREMRAISEIQEQIKQETDPEQKRKLEERLAEGKAGLEDLKNPSSETKEACESEVAAEKKLAKAFELNTKFTGTFNEEKTELTIEQFPIYDRATGKVIVKKVAFKKNK